MPNPSEGKFTPSNPQKYLSDPSKIEYKTPFMLSLMTKMDRQPNILGWMSDGVPTNHSHMRSGIPFENPYTHHWDTFYPDFFVVSIDLRNKQHVEVIEIKSFIELPQTMSGTTGPVSQVAEGEQVLNAARYAEAIRWCTARGYKFRVVDEHMTFNFVY